jgi:hypothetical protein
MHECAFDQYPEQENFLYELGTLLGWQSETLVWMLYGFFDESGEHAASGHLIRLTIGGALAKFETWQALMKDWIAMLGSHHITMFHAANDKANDALMQDIFRIVDKYPMIRLFGSTHRGCQEKSLFKEAYGKGVTDLLKMVHRETDNEAEKFQFIVAEHKDFRIGRIAKYCEKMELVLPRLDGWSSSKPQTCHPLQLSDLIAHAVKCQATGDDRYVKRLNYRHSFHIFSS